MRQINKGLWTAIEKSGLKRWVIAERSGITAKKLSQIVRGFDEPDPATQQRIANVLNCKLGKLFPKTESVNAKF